MDEKRRFGRSLLRAVERFVSDERGLETVEYAIITGLIVAATLTAIAAIGAAVQSKFETLQGHLGG